MLPVDWRRRITHCMWRFLTRIGRREVLHKWPSFLNHKNEEQGKSVMLGVVVVFGREEEMGEGYRFCETR
jgi:hypothetical protein